MATSSIEITQFPMSWFSQYSVDSPPPFTHPLIQSNDPVLKMTHATGDIAQFETYPAPCIFLGTKWTVPDDNGDWREYEAELGVSGISTSACPPMICHLQLQDQIQRDCICLPLSILSWDWFQDKLWIYCYLWLAINPRWLTLWPSMTHGIVDEDIWRMIIGGFPLVLLYDSFTFLTWPILLPFQLVISHHYQPCSIFSYFWLTCHHLAYSLNCLAGSLIHYSFLFCTSCSCALSFNWLSFLPSILHCFTSLKVGDLYIKASPCFNNDNKFTQSPSLSQG